MTLRGLHTAGGMGLGIPVFGEQAQEALTDHWHTSSAVEEQISQLGLGPLSKPVTTCPVLTAADLTTADSRQYTETYARFNEWYNYSVNVLARINIVIIELENTLKRLRLHVKEELLEKSKAAGEKKPSDKTIDDYCANHPKYVTLLHMLQQKKQQRDLVDSRVQQLDHDVKLLSRQVTIRQSDFDNRSRGENLGKSPGMQAPPADAQYYGRS